MENTGSGSSDYAVRRVAQFNPAERLKILLSAVGLGFLVTARNLLVVTALFLIMAVAALAFRARRRRGYGPALMGIAASAAVLIGKFYLESPSAAYAAVFVLIAASVWNSWPVKETAACPQ